ncbi:MAG: hydroxyisourate hydrolase [Sneathiellaceae bacterium]
MGRLTTHVLDLARGSPAAGLALRLFALDGAEPALLAQARTNADGRVDAPLLEGATMRAGRFELLFDAGGYFRSLGLDLAEPGFLEEIPIRFGIASADAHYHVPLLLSPFGYSTYRGS